MFSKDESGAISDRYVAVRLTGGRDITSAVREFMTKYGIGGYPSIMVMNSEGHVVNNRVDRSTDGILGALEKGAELETEFAALKGKEDVESRTKLAGMLADRKLFDEASAAFDKLLEQAPSVGVHTGILKLHQAQGNSADEELLLNEMLELYPKADDRISWRVRLATKPARTLRRSTPPEEGKALMGSAVANLQEILDDLTGTEEAPAGEKAPVEHVAEVRQSMIGLLTRLQRRDEVEEHIDWLLDAGKATKFAPSALLARANLAYRDKDYDAAIEALNQVLEDYPDSDEAKSAPSWIENVQKKKAADSGD